jgi:hypothetical protein
MSGVAVGSIFEILLLLYALTIVLTDRTIGALLVTLALGALVTTSVAYIVYEYRRGMADKA